MSELSCEPNSAGNPVVVYPSAIPKNKALRLIFSPLSYIISQKVPCIRMEACVCLSDAISAASSKTLTIEVACEVPV